MGSVSKFPSSERIFIKYIVVNLTTKSAYIENPKAIQVIIALKKWTDRCTGYCLG